MTLYERYPGAAVVTGASAGIGESFAKSLAKEGFPLILVARRGEILENLAQELREQHSVDVEVVAVDLTVSSAGETVQAVVDEKGWKVSVLVNNAGIGHLCAHDELERNRALRMVDLNCRAAVDLTSRFLPAMLEEGRGAILFLASTLSYQAAPYMSLYAATKGFNLLFAEGLYVECKQRGVDVLAVSPGYTETEFAQVAEVDVRVPRFLAATPEQVVRKSWRKLGRRPSTVHGFWNSMLPFVRRFVSRRFADWVFGKVVRRSSPKLLGQRDLGET